MNLVKHISVFVLSLLIAGLLLGFAVDRSSEASCLGFDVQVNGDAILRFVTQESIMRFIQDHGHSVSGVTLGEIDTYGMEQDLLTIPYIEQATVYKTIDQKVQVNVKQRRPVLRLFMNDGQSCYVDDRAKFLQTSDDFSYKCLPVTGAKNISSQFIMNGDVIVDQQLTNLWKMAGFIQGDEFWNSQIIQVDITEERGVVLIPRVGNHQIIFGDISDYSSKLAKLKTFYEDGIGQTNWNIYQSLDLRYEKQVVGVKR